MKQERITISIILLSLFILAVGCTSSGDDDLDGDVTDGDEVPDGDDPDGDMMDGDVMDEDTHFTLRIENVSAVYDYLDSGAFAIPDGAADPAPIGPAGSYSFSFSAGPGQKLSFATMFVPSNDLFYGTSSLGLDLYDDMGDAISGDVTDQIDFWDAGTEVNEEPGIGPNQPQRQAGADTGTDESGTVQLVSGNGDGYTYPATADVLSVSLTYDGGGRFTATVSNVSDATTLKPSTGTDDQAVPLAPGVFVIHSGDNPLFESGSADLGNGLEALAEDGDPSGLAADLATATGLTSPIAPGVWAVHTSMDPIFTDGSADFGDGLEHLAEDGNPAVLIGELDGKTGIISSDVFTTPEGGSDPAPAFPGEAYVFKFKASEGEYLSFASMLVQSNDLFYAPDGMGIDPFDENGDPLSGDITDKLYLWDAGTETNEAPGAGANQAPRQSGADTGDMENGDVRMIDAANDGFSYPAVGDVIRVTIESM